MEHVPYPFPYPSTLYIYPTVRGGYLGYGMCRYQSLGMITPFGDMRDPLGDTNDPYVVCDLLGWP